MLRENIARKKILKTLDNFQSYAERYLFIRPKEGGRIIPFYFNPVQIWYQQEIEKAKRLGFRKFIVLKSRKCGITTIEQAKSFHRVSTARYVEAFTLAHNKKDTEKIFGIAKLFFDCLPRTFRPKLRDESKSELSFADLHSTFYIGTAGSKGFSRGQTVQRVHGSEVAQWESAYVENLISGILEACPDGEIVFESTANGMTTKFFSIWKDAKDGANNFYPIFIAWYDDPQNRLPIETKEERKELRQSITDEECEIIERYSLSLEQLKFRRQKQKDHKDLFLQEFPEDDTTCFIVQSGINRFSIDMLRRLVRYCENPVEVRDGGQVQIWKKPEKGKYYVAGADVAEGIPGGDYSCAGILERESGEQVASLHGIMKPHVFAKRAATLCREFNDALLAVEANNHGHSALNTLVNTLYYPNLYYHRDYDITRKITLKLGWRTNAKTRTILIDEIDDALENGLMHVNDSEFIAECMNFVDNGTGTYAARPGFHDDRVIMWGIAWQARKVAPISLSAL